MPLLHHQQSGKGTPLLVIHGLFGSLDNLAQTTATLAQYYRVIAVDLRNHGHSFHSDEMNYELMAEDIIQLADHLALDKFICLGHSMGGKTAMKVALICPERVSQLIVADIAPVQYPPIHQSVIRALWEVENAPAISSKSHAELLLSQHIQESAVRQFLLKSLIKEGRPYHWRFNLQAITENYETLSGWTNDNQQYPGPTRFIKGGNSDYLLPRHQDAIARHFPEASAKVIAGAGHWLHAEKPRLFNRLVIDFLTEMNQETK